MPRRIQRLIPILTFLVLLSAAAPVAAITILNVTTTFDLPLDADLCVRAGAPCSLRAAISVANSNPPPAGDVYRIVLGPGLHILLIPGAEGDYNFTGDLDVRGFVEIVGAGVPPGYCRTDRSPSIPADVPSVGGCSEVAAGTTINARNLDRVFDVHSGRLVLTDLAITNGVARGRFEDPLRLAAGGGIRNVLGQLSLNNVAIFRNRASAGAGILNSGELLMVNTTVASNVSTEGTLWDECGGGIFNFAGFAGIAGSLIKDNEAASAGGGICSRSNYPFEFTLHLISSTVSDNRAQYGGGLAVQQTSVPFVAAKIEDSTIAGNRAAMSGGGMFVDREPGTSHRSAGIDLVGSYIVNNQAGVASGDRIVPAHGGGIFSTSNVYAKYSAIRQNWARTGDGGGIYLEGTSGDPLRFFFNRSEISQNLAAGSGAGIYAVESRFELTNVTLSRNNAGRTGGALWAGNTEGLFDRVTILDNRSGSGASGLEGSGSLFTASLTIIGRGGDQPNCNAYYAFRTNTFTAGIFSASDGSLSDRPFTRPQECPFMFTPDLMVGYLQNNGGPTRTHALLEGSPALDVFAPYVADVGSGLPPSVGCPEERLGPPSDPFLFGSTRTDQRGAERPQNTACDAGAYEREVESPLWARFCCRDSFLWVAFAVDTMITTAAEFHALLVQLQEKDGTVLSEQILTRGEAFRKALETFSMSQGPQDGLAALDSTPQDFAALQQALAGLESCCASRPDANSLRLLLALRVARARDAFTTLAAGARNAVLLDAVDQLMQKVRSLGLSTGLEASLLAPLEAARASLARDQRGAAVNQLKAFMQQVQALAGKQLDAKIATALLDTANGVVLALGNQ